MRRYRHCNRLPGRREPRSRPAATVPAFIDSSLVPARSQLSGAAAIARMAQDMREAAYREGGLTEDGMALLGWTAGQIKLHVVDARTLANRQQVAS